MRGGRFRLVACLAGLSLSFGLMGCSIFRDSYAQSNGVPPLRPTDGQRIIGLPIVLADNGTTLAPAKAFTDFLSAPATCGLRRGPVTDTTDKTRIVQFGGDPTKQGSSTPITACSRAVIRQAIDVCVWAGYNFNVADKISTYGLAGVLAATGAAASIASLSHASGTETTQIAAGAAAATAFASNSKSASPALQTVAVSTMESTAEAYLKVSNPQITDPLYTGSASVDDAAEDQAYVRLYDAVLSSCPPGLL